jgi:hypothetical protein
MLMVNMPMGSNKNELKKIVKIIKCNILKFSEIYVFFSYRMDKFS